MQLVVCPTVLIAVPALRFSPHLLTMAQMPQEAVRPIFSNTHPPACLFLAVTSAGCEAETEGREEEDPVTHSSFL